MTSEPPTDPTDAELAAYLRDPTTASGLLPQWIRDGIATDLERAQRSTERLRRLLTNEADKKAVTAETLARRLFGSGNVIHDVVEWKGAEQPSHTYTWGITRCGMRGKTYDVEMWRRGEAAPCKHCEARRAAVTDTAMPEKWHAQQRIRHVHTLEMGTVIGADFEEGLVQIQDGRWWRMENAINVASDSSQPSTA